MNHIMVDLGTLGTTADAVIMSIGAVKFDLDEGIIADEAFYVSISIASNQQYKRRISEETLMWWYKQSQEAKKVFHEPKTALPQALEEFAIWAAEGTDPSKLCVWSNGADFDIPMLTHAADTLNMELPWQFWNHRCYRTYKNMPLARMVKKNPVSATKHHALLDAINQTKHLIDIHKTLFPVVQMKVKA